MTQRKKQNQVSEPESKHKSKKELITEIVKRKTKEKFLSESQKNIILSLKKIKLQFVLVPRELVKVMLL